MISLLPRRTILLLCLLSVHTSSSLSITKKTLNLQSRFARSPPDSSTQVVSSQRRSFFLATAALFTTTAASSVILPTPALALQQRNEALCGTGFFEHIYEYKCTSIGDISDEGASRNLKDEEVAATDSLMGKLGMIESSSTSSSTSLLDERDGKGGGRGTSGNDGKEK